MIQKRKTQWSGFGRGKQVSEGVSMRCGSLDIIDSALSFGDSIVV